MQEKQDAAQVQSAEVWRSTKLISLLGGLSLAAAEIGIQLEHTLSDGLHLIGGAMIGVGAIGLTSGVLVIPSVIGKYRDYKYNKALAKSYLPNEAE